MYIIKRIPKLFLLNHVITSLFKISSYRVIEHTRGFTHSLPKVWCFLTTLNGIEFRRIESIRREGGGEDIVIQSAGTKGLTERESGSGIWSWKSSFFVIEDPRRRKRERERERKKRDRGGGYSWDLSDSPTRSLRSGRGEYFGCENVQIARTDYSKGGKESW